MKKKRYYIYHNPKEEVDLHDIHELIEMGLSKEEIAKELGISKKYVKKVIEEYYEDH
ncbi:MAG TPA: hypothetical protein GXX53_03980 [Tissierellia bacterium]|nr:hypothetical protein [Tissierellia bacterium]